MIKSDLENLETGRAKLVDLVIECPMDGNPEDCPLSHIRHLPFATRIAWVQTLSKAELQEIYSAHCRCMKAKLY